MKSEYLQTPSENAVLAAIDLRRLIFSCYKDAGIEMPENMRALKSHKLWSGRGSDVCLVSGFSAFKASYCCAEDTLRATIAPLLRPGDILEIEFRYCVDENPDCGHHIWQTTGNL